MVSTTVGRSRLQTVIASTLECHLFGWRKSAASSFFDFSRCFDPFPFPTATDAQRADIRKLAEQLDTHRKRQQAAHPTLTLTDLYNVVEKLRAGQPLTSKEQPTYEHGLAAVLDLHAQGLTVREIADKLGLSKSAVHRLTQPAPEK